MCMRRMRVNGRKQKHGWRCRWKSRETGAGTCGLSETSRIQLNYIRWTQPITYQPLCWQPAQRPGAGAERETAHTPGPLRPGDVVKPTSARVQIGRASCRERVKSTRTAMTMKSSEDIEWKRYR